MAFYKSAEVYYSEMTSTMTDVDTSKHSLIYNSLMPCAYELSYQSLMLDEAVKKVFASLAINNGYDEYVVLRCAEQSIIRKTDTYATGVVKVKGRIGYTFPAGALVSTRLGLTYKTDSALTLTAEYGYVNITASAKGSSYNVEIGEINNIPVAYEGILSVTNETKIDNGYDIESLDSLYARYLVKIRNVNSSANKNQYKNWALEVDGISYAEIYEAWNGAGTVLVVVANANKKSCDADLISTCKDYIEAQRPICSGTLTVESVTEVPINIGFTLTYNTSYAIDTVKSNISTKISSYLNDLELGAMTISYNKILSLIMDADGVKDISNLTLNNAILNIVLNDKEVPILGTVTCNVA
jgi:uncharacterized phage protein gp47/JayE